MFRKSIPFIILIVSFSFLLGLTVKPVSAEEIGFDASVNTKTATLGSSIQLTLTFRGGHPDNPPEIPSIDGVEVRYLGPSTSVTIINGQYSSTVAHMYALLPGKTGKFKIPAITVNVAGKTLSSNPIDIEVVDQPAQAVPGTSNPNINQNNDASQIATSIKDKIFLIVEPAKKEVYFNEKVPVNVKLFVNGLGLELFQYPTIEHNGFIVDNFAGQPRKYQQNVGGINYTVFEFNTFVYPTQTGEVSLGPAQIVFNLIFQNRNSSPFSDQFGEDVFDGFFNSVQKREVTVSSADFPLKVLPLPETGKPQDFSGAVGKFSFEATASPSEVNTGDPVTVKMKITGDGNLASVKMPVIKENTDYKLYDPQVKEENGTKTAEQVFIPKSDKVTAVPQLSFSYFDPETKNYQTIARGPFPIKVQKSAQDFKVVGYDRPQTVTAPVPTEQKEEFGQDIVYIKESPGEWRKKEGALYEYWLFKILILSVILSWLALGWYLYHERKMTTDTYYARRIQAPKKARQGLEVCRRFIQENNRREFYNAAYKTLQEYLADKIHLPVGAVTIEALDREFRKHPKSEEILASTKRFFTLCEQVRYASLNIETNNLNESFAQVEQIIDYLERHWR